MLVKAKHRLPIKHNPHTECARCPIRKLALFQPVDQEQLTWTQHFRTAQYELPQKRHLYREGERLDEVYTLFEGWMMLYKTLRDGRRLVLRFALPGDFLYNYGDVCSPVGHSAQTLTPVTLCGFLTTDLGSMFRDQPELAARMTSINARDMALCQEHLAGVGRKTAEERIACLLLELYYRVRIRHGNEGNCIAFPVTQEEIADAVGLTLVHVNRTLRRLRELGLIECANRRLTIHDEEALARLGQFDGSVMEARERLVL